MLRSFLTPWLLRNGCRRQQKINPLRAIRAFIGVSPAMPRYIVTASRVLPVLSARFDDTARTDSFEVS